MGRLAAVALFPLALALGAPSVAVAQDSYLRVATTGVGASVQLEPPGVLRGCDFTYCLYRFPTGTTVTLTATPTEPGAALAAWDGGCAAPTVTCPIVVDATKTVVVRFTPVRVYTDRQLGRGVDSVSPPGAPCGRACSAYAYGTPVTLTATPAAGWVFSRWDGLCSTTTTANVCARTLLGDVESRPVFDCDGCRLGGWYRPVVPVSMTTAGRGSVYINNRQCRRETCSPSLQRGRAVSLLAFGGTFLGWDGRGCGAGTARRCQLDVMRSMAGQAPAVIARFG